MDVVMLVDQDSNLLTWCVALASCRHTSSYWELTASQGGPLGKTALFARKLLLLLS